MVDIPITFSTNATDVEPKIVRLYSSTDKLDFLTNKLGKTWGRVEHAIIHLSGSFGRHIGLGEKMGGVVGKLVIGYVILERTMRIVDSAFEKYDKRIEATIENEQELEKAIRKTNLAQSQRGLDFGKKEGASIRKLTATGGLELAGKFANKTGDYGESAKAVLDAKHKFGGDAEQYLNLASRISNVNGKSLSDNVNALHKGDLSNPDIAAQRVINRDKDLRGTSFIEAEKRVSASTTVGALNRAANDQGVVANNDLRLVSQGGLASGAARVEALEPLAVLTAEKFAASMEKLQVLTKISENTGYLRNVYEWIKSPGHSASENMVEASQTVH